MTTPVGGTSQPDRPANTRIRNLTAALVAAVGLAGIVLATRTPVVNVRLCTLGDSTAQQVVADVLRPSGAPSDTILPLDSALVAALDPASRASLAGLHVLRDCADLQEDTTVVPPAVLAAHDSLMAADSAKWKRGDTLSLSTDRDYWHLVLGPPGAPPP